MRNKKYVQNAIYTEQNVEEYKENPLIEALPKYSEDELLQIPNQYPYFDECERKLPIYDRIQCVERIYECFQILNFHLGIVERILNVIRQGYVHRNPIEKDFTEYINLGYKAILEKNIDIYGINKSRRNTAEGFAIIGTSGMGKTSIVNKALSLYPQLIRHTEYKNDILLLNQIVWMKLDCSFDGSVKGLCLNFFYQIDQILGTSYYKEYKNNRIAVNAMMPIIAQIAQTNCLGVLVIDEIQHLSVAKSGGIEKMLNFFVTLTNLVGIPIILIGTPKANPIITSEFRQARRSSGQGSIDIEKLEKGDDWELLLEVIFKYQWTNKKFELTKELSDTLYEKSLGIIDIAIKLYVATQKAAIRNEEDVITAKLMKEVFEREFPLIEKILKQKRNEINNEHKKTKIYNESIEEMDKKDLRKITNDEGDKSNYDKLKENGIIK